MNVLASLLAASVTLPAFVYATECLAALVTRTRVRSRSAASPASAAPRFAVLVPAHDEALLIGDTLDALRAQLRPGDRILVVADNCSDDTAAIARARGAGVCERNAAGRRGKGYAIAFGLDHLASDPPDVLILVDADSRVEGAGLAALAAEAHARGCPIQADYLLHAPADAGHLARISAFALLVRNRVRPLGLLALGLPTQLTGSGMAFPWKQIREAPELGSDLVEDLALGIALAERGHPARFLPEVTTRSVLPDRERAAAAQRTRWEQGQLATLLRRAPALVWRGIASGRADLVGLGLDLATPPLALLVLLLAGVSGLAGVGAALGLSILPLAIALGGLGLVGVSTLGAWWAFGRETLSLRTLAAAPLYVLWKLPIYAGFLLRRQRSWVRTERDAAPPRPEGDGRPR